jgi:hypothetical protein
MAGEQGEWETETPDVMSLQQGGLEFEHGSIFAASVPDLMIRRNYLVMSNGPQKSTGKASP